MSFTWAFSKVLFFNEILTASFLFLFYWSIVDLQCGISFECTAKWFSYTGTYIHSFLDYFLIEVIPEYWVEFPVLYGRSLLVIHLIYCSVCSFQAPDLSLPHHHCPLPNSVLSTRLPVIFSFPGVFQIPNRLCSYFCTCLLPQPCWSTPEG